MIRNGKDYTALIQQVSQAQILSWKICMGWDMKKMKRSMRTKMQGKEYALKVVGCKSDGGAPSH